MEQGLHARLRALVARRIEPRAAEQLLRPGTAVEQIVAAEADQRVVAGKATDQKAAGDYPDVARSPQANQKADALPLTSR